jgi:hypothetical protein
MTSSQVYSLCSIKRRGDEWGRVRMEAFMAYFKELSILLLGGSEEKYEKPIR